TATANPDFPNLLPELAYDGSGSTITWKDFSPRASVNIALDESKKTVARASYARYAGQLFPNDVTVANPVGGYFAAGAAYTWRKVTDVSSWFPRIGMTSADYTANPTVTQNGVSANSFSPNPAKVAASNSGRYLTNRPDYSTGYNGLELTLVKRMSNKWFARAALSYMDWHENLGPGAIQNPTRTDVTGGQAGQATTNPALAGVSGPSVDGGQLAPRSGGSGKGDIFFNARWQMVMNGLYQLPGNFEVGTSLFARQGYVYPVILRLDAGADGTLRTLATPHLDDQRYDTVFDADFRLANRIQLPGRSTME